MDISVSVDLGTTNTVTSVDDGKEITELNIEGSYLLPSCVWFRDDKEVICGKRAQRQITSIQKNRVSKVVTNSKRLIGKYYNEKDVKIVKKFCGVPIVEKDKKPVFYIDETYGYYTPIQIAEIIIKKVITEVKAKYPDRKIGKFLVTVPANFSSNQRTATESAAKKVLKEEGFAEIEINTINEPTAAAILYGVENPSEKERLLLVYDFGGGTFDTSLLKITKDKFDVVAHYGDPELGGCDCDSAIADAFLNHKNIKDDHLMETIPDEHKEAKLRAIQVRACECKEALSHPNRKKRDVMIRDLFFVTNNNPEEEEEEDVDFDYTREEMNDVIRKLIEKTMNVVDSLLKDNNKTVQDIDNVILVGGSSNLCLVSEMLKEKFGEKILKNVNPETCVSKGGCYYLRNYCITERIAFSLGCSIKGNRVSWIIPKHSVIPCEFTETFQTSFDNQESVTSHVMQGDYEDKEGFNQIEPITNKHIQLPSYTFTGFPKKPEGEVQFLETYSYIKKGVVHIKVVLKGTDKVLFDDDIVFT